MLLWTKRIPPALGSTAAESPQSLALFCIASTGGILPLPRQRSDTQSGPTLCNPMDRSPPSSSVHGMFQARILEWVAISSSLPRQTTPLLHVWVIRQINHSPTQDNSEGPCQLLTPFRMLTPSWNYITAEILYLLNPASSFAFYSPPLSSPPHPLPFSSFSFPPPILSVLFPSVPQLAVPRALPNNFLHSCVHCRACDQENPICDHGQIFTLLYVSQKFVLHMSIPNHYF